jgi:hypothetical protein
MRGGADIPNGTFENAWPIICQLHDIKTTNPALWEKLPYNGTYSSQYKTPSAKDYDINSYFTQGMVRIAKLVREADPLDNSRVDWATYEQSLKGFVRSTATVTLGTTDLSEIVTQLKNEVTKAVNIAIPSAGTLGASLSEILKKVSGLDAHIGASDGAHKGFTTALADIKKIVDAINTKPSSSTGSVTLSTADQKTLRDIQKAITDAQIALIAAISKIKTSSTSKTAGEQAAEEAEDFADEAAIFATNARRHAKQANDAIGTVSDPANVTATTAAATSADKAAILSEKAAQNAQDAANDARTNALSGKTIEAQNARNQAENMKNEAEKQMKEAEKHMNNAIAEAKKTSSPPTSGLTTAELKALQTELASTNKTKIDVNFVNELSKSERFKGSILQVPNLAQYFIGEGLFDLSVLPPTVTPMRFALMRIAEYSAFLVDDANIPSYLNEIIAGDPLLNYVKADINKSDVRTAVEKFMEEIFSKRDDKKLVDVKKNFDFALDVEATELNSFVVALYVFDNGQSNKIRQDTSFVGTNVEQLILQNTDPTNLQRINIQKAVTSSKMDIFSLKITSLKQAMKKEITDMTIGISDSDFDAIYRAISIFETDPINDFIAKEKIIITGGAKLVGGGFISKNITDDKVLLVSKQGDVLLTTRSDPGYTNQTEAKTGFGGKITPPAYYEFDGFEHMYDIESSGGIKTEVDGSGKWNLVLKPMGGKVDDAKIQEAIKKVEDHIALIGPSVDTKYNLNALKTKKDLNALVEGPLKNPQTLYEKLKRLEVEIELGCNPRNLTGGSLNNGGSQRMQGGAPPSNTIGNAAAEFIFDNIIMGSVDQANTFSTYFTLFESSAPVEILALPRDSSVVSRSTVISRIAGMTLNFNKSLEARFFLNGSSPMIPLSGRFLAVMDLIPMVPLDKYRTVYGAKTPFDLDKVSHGLIGVFLSICETGDLIKFRTGGDVKLKDFDSDEFSGLEIKDKLPIDQRSLKGILSSSPVSLVEWKRNNEFLAAVDALKAKEWQRDGKTGNFYRLVNGQRTNDEGDAEKVCLLSTDSGKSQCHHFISKCLANPEGKFTNECRDFFGKDRLLKLGETEMRSDSFSKYIDEIKSLSPAHAVVVLNKFHFRRKQVTEDYFDLKNVNIKKVESVGEWIKTIDSDANLLYFGDGNKDAGKQIIDEMKKNNDFLNYLEILSTYVNASVYYLNPEIEKISRVTKPRYNESYKVYDYVNPYVTMINSVENIRDSMGRLRSAVQNNYLGYNGDLLIRSFIASPTIAAPFNPAAYTSYIPSSTLYPGFFNGNMRGGADEEIDFKNLGVCAAEDYQHYLQKVLEIAAANNLTIDPAEKQEIDNKVSKLKEQELKMRELLTELINWFKLYNHTNGYINSHSGSVGTTERPDIYKKHENFLNLSKSYQKRTTNVMTYIQFLSDAVAQAVKKEMDSKQQTTVPTSTDYIRM